jgi:hypothetical protein
MASSMNMARSESRFLFLAGFALLGASLTGSVTHAADAPIVLENGHVSLEIDSVFGTIVRIVDKSSRIDLVSSPSLAAIFRLDLLMPDKKTVAILGRDQKLSGVSRTSDSLTLRWNGPLKDTAGDGHKIAVRMDVKAAGNELQFGLHLDNGSNCKVKEVLYPIVGGLSGFGAPGRPADGVIWVPTSSPSIRKIGFPFEPATFGYPGQATMSFTCIQSPAAKKSLYFASHDSIARYKVFHFEEQSKDKVRDVVAWIQHLPYTLPGKSFDGSTVVLQVVDGDWRSAGRTYRSFFTSTFGLADPNTDWIRKQSFFLFTMFMLPEGTINYTYKDIPRWAKAAKDYGVNAVQISGWETCGHDNGLPYYTPDPRLGTWKELEEGIRACHQMGLKVFFFVNYQEMTIDTAWYKSELEKYREWTENGDLTGRMGWGYGTLWGRMGHPWLMTKADLGFSQFRKIITDQFEALAKIGADGVHVDKMFPAPFSFNPDSPMSPDTSTFEGAILLSKEVFAACRKHNPNWAMSFECNWDRMLQFGGCTWWVGNQLITRSVFPENAEMQVIQNPYDYLAINNLVRGGHHVMISPMAFSRGMDWKPCEGLNDYIRDVKAIRDKLQDTVFSGEVLGRDGIKLGGSTPPGVDYNVFRNRGTALRACIMTNASMSPRTQAIEGFDGARSPSARIHQPSYPSYVVNLPGSITIPGEQIVFIAELAEKAETTAPSVPPSRLTVHPVAPDAPVPELPPFDPTKSVRLADKHILVEVSRDNGSVTRVRDKRANLDLILEPRLAQSWTFAFPLPGKEPWRTIDANWIVGSQQRLSAVHVDGKKLSLKWNGPLVNYLGEKYGAAVAGTIELADGGAIFNLTIENHTPYRVGETYYPVLGGIQGLGLYHGQLQSTEFVRPNANGSVEKTDIFRTFTTMIFGGQGPEQYYAYPETLPESWISLQSPQISRSVYIGAQDPSDRKKVARLQLLPGNSGTSREDGNWPRPSELNGVPVGVEVSFVDCAGGLVGRDYRATPVFVKFCDGDWREAKNIYKGWKEKCRPATAK